MSKKIFTDEQVNILKQHIYIENVTCKSITYKDEFKKLAVEKYKQGLTPRQIFRFANFDIKIVGYKRMKSSIDRWRKISDRLEGYSDLRRKKCN